jgi:hypothetical protein
MSKPPNVMPNCAATDCAGLMYMLSIKQCTGANHDKRKTEERQFDSVLVLVPR